MNMASSKIKKFLKLNFVSLQILGRCFAAVTAFKSSIDREINGFFT